MISLSLFGYGGYGFWLAVRELSLEPVAGIETAAFVFGRGTPGGRSGTGYRVKDGLMTAAVVSGEWLDLGDLVSLDQAEAGHGIVRESAVNTDGVNQDVFIAHTRVEWRVR